MRLDDVTVVIPAFNEELGIGRTLRMLRDHYPDLNIIVVDDGSSDNTSVIAEKIVGVKVIRHETNRGYGAALKTGMKAVRTRVTTWFDADGQHRPEDLLKIVRPVLAKECDACLGVRDKSSSFVISRLPGKALLRMVSQLIARRRIPDLNCGLRAFNTNIIRAYIHILPNGFSASTTSTLLFLKRGYLVRFEDVHASARIGHSTVRLRDGIRTLKLIVRIMVIFDGFLFFLGLSLLQIVPGIIYFLIRVYTDQLGIPVLGAIAVISGLLTFCFGFLSSQLTEMRQEQFELMTRYSADKFDAERPTMARRVV